MQKGSSRIHKLLEEFHFSPIGGHSGYIYTYKRLSENIYWEGMKRDVQDFVARCDICQKNKSQTLSPAGLLQPLPIPHHVWEDISMDFITRLPKSHRLIIFWLWWIVLLSMPILFHFHTLLMLMMWPLFHKGMIS